MQYQLYDTLYLIFFSTSEANMSQRKLFCHRTGQVSYAEHRYLSFFILPSIFMGDVCEWNRWGKHKTPPQRVSSVLHSTQSSHRMLSLLSVILLSIIIVLCLNFTFACFFYFYTLKLKGSVYPHLKKKCLNFCGMWLIRLLQFYLSTSRGLNFHPETFKKMLQQHVFCVLLLLIVCMRLHNWVESIV